MRMRLLCLNLGLRDDLKSIDRGASTAHVHAVRGYFPHHFPNIVAFALQHCAGTVDRIPTTVSRETSGNGGMTSCMGLTLTCRSAGPG